MKIQCKQHKDYLPSLRALNIKGGKYKKAVEKSNHIEKTFQYSLDNLKNLNTTNHGESRIQHCIKYELAGACRLVTLQEKHIVLFCFVGTHEQVDYWIDQHKGSTLVNQHGKISLIPQSEDIHCIETRITGNSALTTGLLYQKLDPKYLSSLASVLAPQTLNALKLLESTHQEDQIFSIAVLIKDNNKAALIYDTFCLLRQNNIEHANERVQLFLGEISEIQTLTDSEVDALIDSDQIKHLATDDPHYSRVFNYYINNASYMDWMLFLNSEQEKIVNQDFSGIAKLLGVSGSGKTCIVIHRALRLAKKYPSEKILIITLNRSLARLINTLVDHAALPEIRQQIEVKAFFEVCQSYLYQFDDKNKKIYDDTTWKSEEHIDAIWREYYRCELNNRDARVLLPVHDYLISKSIHAETYIREEFDWIRSALNDKDRNNYLSIERKGRSYRLEKKYRTQLLKGLVHWEQKMKAIGISDYLGLLSALEPYAQMLEAPYRCVLVDESQDFGTTELALIRKLVRKNENDLFFSGDAAQKVSCKHQFFAKAGVATHKSRTRKIFKNYRNSREILEFANNVLFTHATNKQLTGDEFELLRPEYANVNGATPLVLEGTDLAHEISAAYAYMQSVDVMGGEQKKKGCIAICGYSLYEIEQYAKQYRIPVLN
ncbi:MAG: UvrD-helicase domain-containing protein, partial [Cocleimonas sp.]|nr:UvrD-helicase domain-containing protein [Cocleimonas sp.]